MIVEAQRSTNLYNLSIFNIIAMRRPLPNTGKFTDSSNLVRFIKKYLPIYHLLIKLLYEPMWIYLYTSTYWLFILLLYFERKHQYDRIPNLPIYYILFHTLPIIY